MKLNKRFIALTLASIMLSSLAGSSKTKENKPSNYPEGYSYIDQTDNDFNSLRRIVIRNGKQEYEYKGSNIILAFDKDTFEAKIYLFDNKDIFKDIYDINTGYMIVDRNIYHGHSCYASRINLGLFTNKYYTVDLASLGIYIDGFALQEYYSLEDIESLIPLVREELQDKYSPKIITRPKVSSTPKRYVRTRTIRN